MLEDLMGCCRRRVGRADDGCSTRTTGNDGASGDVEWGSHGRFNDVRAVRSRSGRRVHPPFTPHATYSNAIRPRSDSTSVTGSLAVSAISSRAWSTLSHTFHSSTPRTAPDCR